MREPLGAAGAPSASGAVGAENVPFLPVKPGAIIRRLEGTQRPVNGCLFVAQPTWCACGRLLPIELGPDGVLVVVVDGVGRRLTRSQLVLEHPVINPPGRAV